MTSALRLVQQLWAWLTLSDYESSKSLVMKEIEARYARGNVNSQNGESLDEDELERMSKAADKAMERLNRSRDKAARRRLAA